jgi:hypothetical protein
LVWKWEMKKKGDEEKPTKVPYQARNPKRQAKSNQPKTWATYAQACEAYEHEDYLDGIGFVLTNTDIAAFDIDDCRDPSTGEIHAWAWALVQKANSYTEITVSGTGLRIIGTGTGFAVHRKLKVKDGVTCEPYRKATRYLVMTGNQIGTAGLANIDVVINETLEELDARPGGADDGGQHARQTPDDEDPLAYTIRQGEAGRFDGHRAQAEFYVINEMFRRGYTAKAIAKVLLDPANRISEKALGEANPAKYVLRQIAQAKKKIGFTVDERNKPRPSTDNIHIALLKLSVTLRYDKFADHILINGLPGFGPILDDAAVDRLWVLFEQRFKFRPAKEVLRTVVADTARLNSFHPVCDYLNSVQPKWDGKKRMDTWLTKYGGAEDNEYTRAVGALMLTAAVRRVRQPGCKFDEMPVLENPEQGTNKSTALRVLAVRDEWFLDDLPLNCKTREMIELLQGRWIVEVAELSGMRRGDIEHVKAQLSRQYDRARLVWDRFATDKPRQCVFVGTTNPTEYLKDTSGNRRFWPIRVKRFDVEALRTDRDQLWAEAAALEATGVSIRLEERLWPVAAREQAKRLTDDAFYEVLQHELGDMNGKISSKSVWAILDMKAGARGNEQSLRMSQAMQRMGWQRPNDANLIKIGGKPVVGWAKGPQPWETIEAYRGDYNQLVIHKGLDGKM